MGLAWLTGAYGLRHNSDCLLSNDANSYSRFVFRNVPLRSHVHKEEKRKKEEFPKKIQNAAAIIFSSP
ncbi:hypothetical protein F2P81_022494 [Scophthalmus maximus]|uniref:Uncharacterized protein n=1 Tax=Scophthalmus maximus TaxID=52904 RepID=A0A6A4RUE4_SCOMX|nr:hypothetical protein F2P81_022494 [Scophthalmus maximus]